MILNNKDICELLYWKIITRDFQCLCTVSTCTVARPWFPYFVPFLLTLVPPCYRLPCGNVLVSFPHPFAIPGLMPPCSLYAFLLPGYYPPVSLPQNLYRFFCLFYPQVYRLSILYPFFPFLLLFALRVSVFFSFRLYTQVITSLVISFSFSSVLLIVPWFPCVRSVSSVSSDKRVQPSYSWSANWTNTLYAGTVWFQDDEHWLFACLCAFETRLVPHIVYSSPSSSVCLDGYYWQTFILPPANVQHI